MTITVLPGDPYYAASASGSANIVGKWDCALNGRPYMLDLKTGAFVHRSVPLLRQQADQSSAPTEASINPEDLWRRSQDSWHMGAGQSFFDRGDDSNAARFNESKGVDVWTKWQLSLLPDTDQKLASAATNLHLVAVGTYLYATDGQVLKRTADVSVDAPMWTTITGTPAATLLSITSDGYNVYVTDGANIYSGTRGAATVSSWSTFDSSLLGFVKGRLMSGQGNIASNITGSAAKTDVVTQPNTDFVWVGFAEGPGHIFMAGFSGDKSLIYKTAIKADGTALDAGSVAGELPDGEIVRAIQGYLGFLLIGTDQGVRFAAIDGDGNLTIGSLIPTDAAVGCFEPQDRFVWYGLTNYDASSTGLGRIDLRTLTGSLTPAYASDLMVTGQGAVQSVVTFGDRRVLGVSGLGIYAETDTVVAAGTLSTGQITYRLPDDKVAMFADVRHDRLGEHSLAISTEGSAFSTLGTHTTSEDAFPCGQVSGSRHELRLTLTAVDDESPVIRSVTLRSYPAASTVLMISAPVLLAELNKTWDGDEVAGDPGLELATLTALRNHPGLLTWQEGDQSYQVVLDDFEWRPSHPTEDFSAWNGTLILSLKVVQ